MFNIVQSYARRTRPEEILVVDDSSNISRLDGELVDYSTTKPSQVVRAREILKKSAELLSTNTPPNSPKDEEIREIFYRIKVLPSAISELYNEDQDFQKAYCELPQVKAFIQHVSTGLHPAHFFLSSRKDLNPYTYSDIKQSTLSLLGFEAIRSRGFMIEHFRQTTFERYVYGNRWTFTKLQDNPTKLFLTSCYEIATNIGYIKVQSGTLPAFVRNWIPYIHRLVAEDSYFNSDFNEFFRKITAKSQLSPDPSDTAWIEPTWMDLLIVSGTHEKPAQFIRDFLNIKITRFDQEQIMKGIDLFYKIILNFPTEEKSALNCTANYSIPRSISYIFNTITRKMKHQKFQF